jgi:nitrate reductase NapAB chaperone NapD
MRGKLGAPEEFPEVTMISSWIIRDKPAQRKNLKGFLAGRPGITVREMSDTLIVTTECGSAELNHLQEFLQDGPGVRSVSLVTAFADHSEDKDH